MLLELERLRAENAALRSELHSLRGRNEEIRAQQARCVEVTERRIHQLELECFAHNATLRGTQSIVQAAYGEEHRPYLAGLQRRMKEHGRTARALLDRGREQAREQLLCVAADDLYFHRQDVKVVIEPCSMAMLNLGRWDGNSGLDRVVWLEEFTSLELLVSDLGVDLVGAAGTLGLFHQADCFHEVRWFDRKLLEPLSRRETRLRKAWEDALDRATRPHGPGRRLSAAKVEAAWKRAQAAEAAFFRAVEAVDRIHELFGARDPATRRLWSEETAEAALDEVIAICKSIGHPVGDRAARHVRTNRRRYHAHMRIFDSIPVSLRPGSIWSPRTVLNAILRLWDLENRFMGKTADEGSWLDSWRLHRQLTRKLRRECDNLGQVEDRLRYELAHLRRSSSGVESLNSRLRVLQMVHRNVSDEMLALLALAWNLTPRPAAGKRKKCLRPYDALGVDIGQSGKPWYDVLLDEEEKLRKVA